MFEKIPPSIVILLVLSLSQVPLSFSQEVHSIWNKFWSVSCEFSDIVHRTRRSVYQEPNFDDPTELFEYLYPLADIKLDEASEQRSSTHSLATWIDDVVDLWSSECYSRLKREKRNSNQDKEDGRYPVDEDGYPYEEVLSNTKGNKSAKNATLTFSTAAPAQPKKEKTVIADGDTFFAQYGGDIEYFFPLIAFGIPFDGEITFLGFHGFKGLFPYK